MPQNLSEMKNDQNFSYVEEFSHEKGVYMHVLNI